MANNPVKWSAFGTHAHLLTAANMDHMDPNDVLTSGEVDNSTGDQFADFILTVNPEAVFHAGDYFCAWLIKASDGTNYETLLNGTVPARSPDIIWPVGVEAASGHAAQIITVGPVLLPAGKFKCVLQNKSNEILEEAANGNSTLDMYPYNDNIVSA
jgi:hypothetical protein